MTWLSPYLFPRACWILNSHSFSGLPSPLIDCTQRSLWSWSPIQSASSLYVSWFLLKHYMFGGREGKSVRLLICKWNLACLPSKDGKSCCHIAEMSCKFSTKRSTDTNSVLVPPFASKQPRAGLAWLKASQTTQMQIDGLLLYQHSLEYHVL